MSHSPRIAPFARYCTAKPAMRPTMTRLENASRPINDTPLVTMRVVTGVGSALGWEARGRRRRATGPFGRPSRAVGLTSPRGRRRTMRPTPKEVPYADPPRDRPLPARAERPDPREGHGPSRGIAGAPRPCDRADHHGGHV